MLCAWATHAEGVGFERAILLVWNPHRALFEGHLAWRASLAPLDEVLAASRQSGPDGPEPEASAELRTLALTPESLPADLARLWGAHGAGMLGGEAMASLEEFLPGRWGGAIALARDQHGYGLLVGSWPDEGRPVDRQASLDAFRRIAQGVLARESADDERKRRAQHTAALTEFAHAAVSDLNVAELLHLLSRLAGSATSARGSAVWLGSSAAALRLEATSGPGGTRERLARAIQPLAGSALDEPGPVIVDRSIDEERLAPEVAAQLSSLALFPIGVSGRRRGVLGVYDRASFHPGDSPAFARVDLEFLASLADHAALALEHAARLESLRGVERRARDLQQRLRRSDRLASIGETALRMAQEVRNPIASIAAFARRVHRELAAEDSNREYLEIVIREADRLERWVGEQLQATDAGEPRFGLESLNQIVQEALQQCGEKLVRRRVRLLKKLSPDVPPLLLDAPRIRRVIGNILEHALESVAPGGRIRIESRRVQQYVLVDVAHDGAHPGGELLGQLFVPFAGGKAGTGGLGLALAQQVVHEHGGEIRVRSEGEWSTVFSFTLPISINQDRRGAAPERRGVRTDRRRRTPAH
jgi:signal transduction histidine kinase